MEEKSSIIKDTAEAVKGIVEAVPIYEDALQPLAKEVGKAGQTIGKLINFALLPITGLVWGYDKIGDYITQSLSEKLKDIPEERITTPNPIIAGPALEALRYSGHDETLRDMYSNLLATAMDTETIHQAHPSFVEIIKQLTPDEARILKLFASNDYFAYIDLYVKLGTNKGEKCAFKHFSILGEIADCYCKDLIANYLENLSRLGLIEMDDRRVLVDKEKYYEPLEKHSKTVKMISELKDKMGLDFRIQRGTIETTNLGMQFIKACVVDHNSSLNT